MKNVNKLYELAEEKFKINKCYDENKNVQDFMEMIRRHLKENKTSSGKIKYDGRYVEIKDIVNEWEVLIDTYKDSISLNSFSSLKSGLTIGLSVIGSVFVGSQKTSYEDKKFYLLVIIGIVLVVVTFVLFGIIDEVEKHFEKDVIYERRFYSICLKILKEVEGDLSEKEENSKLEASVDQLEKHISHKEAKIVVLDGNSNRRFLRLLHNKLYGITQRLKHIRLKKEEDVYAKDKKILKKINNQDEQNYYKEKREWVKEEYEKDNKYKSLDNIRLEKERISGKLNQINSQFPALIISLLIMYLSLNIPAISKLLNYSLIPNIEFIVQIILTIVVFYYLLPTLMNTSDEFRCLRICKSVLEEMEKEKLDETNNELYDIKNDLKEVKRFLGI